MTSMILVDTSVLIDFLQGAETKEAAFLERILNARPDRLAVTDLSYLEILQGVRQENTIQQIINALQEFITVSPSGTSLMIKAASNYRSLRKIGVTARSTIDCLIATIAIENGWSLLHRDRDFIPFETHLGLKSAMMKE